MAALLAAVALVACGGPAAQTVARVDNVTLSRQELDARIDRIAKGQQPQGQAQGQAGPSRLEIEKQVVDLFVTQNLMLGIARQKGVAVSDSEVDKQIDQFRQQIAQAGGGTTFDEVVQQQLGFTGGDSSDFRQFASFVLAQQKLAETLVTTDTVRTSLADQYKGAEVADVAHILITVPQGADDATRTAAETKAKDVIARLDKGEDFAALAKELSEDPGSKDNGGVYKLVPHNAFVPEFDKAMFQDLKPGETTKEPVKTDYGYHIIRLISRGPLSDEALQKLKQGQLNDTLLGQQIEQQVGQQLQQERGQALQKLITDERTKAKADGRLEEPTYPEPTPEPAPPPQQPAQPGQATAEPQGQPPTSAPTQAP
jgi:parvulin-like peptidyl-prolyl isomerase